MPPNPPCEVPNNHFLDNPMNEDYAMFDNWLHIGILDAGVVLGEDCFDFNPNLEGGMVLLTVL